MGRPDEAERPAPQRARIRLLERRASWKASTSLWGAMAVKKRIVVGDLREEVIVDDRWRGVVASTLILYVPVGVSWDYILRMWALQGLEVDYCSTGELCRSP